jgi:pSer/pThr/pTyr-binding forkhead associated (FHA) protein
MEVRLLIKPKNEGQPQEIALSGPKQFLLGRGPSSAALLDGPGISREHVVVNVDESEIYAMDVSVNGTWVNGKRLAQNQNHRVEDGDVIEIPGYDCVVRVDTAVQQPKPDSGSPLETRTQSLPPPPRGPVSSFIVSFTLLDAVMIAFAVIAILLVVVYLLS